MKLRVLARNSNSLFATPSELSDRLGRFGRWRGKNGSDQPTEIFVCMSFYYVVVELRCYVFRLLFGIQLMRANDVQGGMDR